MGKTNKWSQLMITVKSPKLGSYIIPEVRIDSCVLYIKKALGLKKPELTPMDLAQAFGYKTYVTGSYYRVANSLQAYGLIEGRGKLKLSNLGMNLPYPENEAHKWRMYGEAVLNVPLWKKLHDLYPDGLPKETPFWVILRNVTGCSNEQAHEADKEVKLWYSDDISWVVKGEVVYADPDGKSFVVKPQNSFMGDPFKSATMQSQFTIPNTQSQNKIQITFEDVTIILPKDDLENAYDRLQKYMKVYLETHPKQIKKDESKSRKNEVTIENEPKDDVTVEFENDNESPDR